VRRTRKGDVYAAAISGGRLDGGDVVAVARDKSYVTYRHTWPPLIDGRAWDALSRAAMRVAESVADETGRSVTIYAREGFVVDVVSPLSES